MKTVKEMIITSLPWIISTILAIGAYGATVKFQGNNIDKNTTDIINTNERIVCLEKAIVKIESMQADIHEIKEDIKDIKRVIFKPIADTRSDKERDMTSISVASSPR